MKQAEWEKLTDAQQAEFLAKRLRERLDRVIGDGLISDSLRYFAELAELRVNAVHEALSDGDVLRAWRILYWAEEAFGLAVDRWYAPVLKFGKQMDQPRARRKAERGRGRKAKQREENIIETCTWALGHPDKRRVYRFKSGKPNKSELRRLCQRYNAPGLGDRQIREIIQRAIRDGKLA